MRTIELVLAAATAALLLTAAAPAEAPVSAEPDKSQEMVCRKEKETGSLVRAKKTCHTRAQWAYIDDENQRFSRNLVDDTRTRPAGN